MSELNTVKTIVEYINNNKIGRVWPNEIAQGIPSKYSPTGYRRVANKSSADIIGSLYPSGRAVYLEVKEEKYRKKVTDIYNQMKEGKIAKGYVYDKNTMHLINQANWLLWASETGAIVGFVFNLQDVLDLLLGKISER